MRPVLFAGLVLLGACSRSVSAPGPVNEYAMGTVCTVNLFEKGKPELYRKVFDRYRELEDILSANKDGTDLDTVNRNAGVAPVKVRPELITVLDKALVYAEKSGGFFDPSIGPLVKLWGIGTARAHIPGGDEIRKALTMVNYRDVEIDREKGTVYLKRPGMALDLGGIAKGYAADEAVRILAENGIDRAIIDLGGNVFAMGERSVKKNLGDTLKNLIPGGENKKTAGDESYWRVGIQDPRESRGNYLGILRVINQTVVTSGVYERYFEEGGKRYHHILSVETGFPVDTGLLSVTVVSDKSIDADALSTAAFALGWPRGRDLLASIPGVRGIFVYDDMSVHLTAGLEKDFTLTAAEYHLAND